LTRKRVYALPSLVDFPSKKDYTFYNKGACSMGSKYFILTLLILVPLLPLFGQNTEDFTLTQNKEGTVVITGYRGAEKEITIPSSINGIDVTAIGHKAFRNMALTSVTLPGTITFIGTLAFADNELTEIALPPGLKEIGISAFADNKLTNVAIPDSVSALRFAAFSRNPINSVTIPRGLGAIQPKVFLRNELAEITIGTGAEIYIQNFELGFINYYASRDKQAGTYVKNDGVWRVENNRNL
jgi:hypothetical protein